MLSLITSPKKIAYMLLAAVVLLSAGFLKGVDYEDARNRLKNAEAQIDAHETRDEVESGVDAADDATLDSLLGRWIRN